MRLARILPFILFMLPCAHVPAQAGAAPRATAAFNVTPLRLEIPSDQDASQMLLRNDSDGVLAVQIRIFSWNQQDGNDNYSQSSDFIVSPSIVRIDPDRTQTLHIIAAVKPDANVEASYRVVIDQLPQSIKQEPGAAQTRLRMTIPLFSGGDRAPVQNLRFSVNENILSITNAGGRTAKIGGLSIEQASQPHKFPRRTTPRYILGGATVRVALPDGVQCDGDAVRITAIVDRKAIDAIPTQSCS